jgi:acrylyl-CoA reductase (NADPH)
MCPQPIRREAWKRLASDLDRATLQAMTTEVALPGVLATGADILEGRVRGRIVVKIG